MTIFNFRFEPINFEPKPFVSPEEYAIMQQELFSPEDEQLTDDQMQMMNLLYDTNDMENRIHDIKNRIELRRMLAEYESRNKPSSKSSEIPYDLVLPDEEDRKSGSSKNAGQLEENPFLTDKEDKRAESIFTERQEELENAKKLEEILEEAANEEFEQFPQKSTSFREVAIAEHIPTVNNYHLNDDVDTNFFNPKNTKHHLQKPRDYEEMNDIPDIYLVSRDHMSNFRDDKMGDGGVYTEGGLVYIPASDKSEAKSLLQSIMGFTRHERLDVKKPGPPPQIPPSSQSPHEPPTDEKSADSDINPAYFKADDASKAKKVIHGEEDHGSFSVDTEYAHVILKNPLDNWKDGARIVQALGEMLNLQNYFTHPRVDRHEVSFRVEPNPEKKTASDVAKSINDSRFKNNLSRRLGVLVSRAGVGDKVKDFELSNMDQEKLERAEDAPNMTHVMIYMFAGAGCAALVVIFITLFLIRRHDKKKTKLGGLQTGISAAETCSKDYQELCRARMAGKNNETSTGRIASITKENDRPPSSRSSTSSWSEEPALSNMDISTGHMVLVSSIDS
jgi:receptor-type tyrosine-protein phosphatase N